MKTFVEEPQEGSSIAFTKIRNQQDGSRKAEPFAIGKKMISKKKPTLICPECKKLGTRTKYWRKDCLYVCKIEDCHAMYYWESIDDPKKSGGFYYV
jgi:hypothetical protein